MNTLQEIKLPNYITITILNSEVEGSHFGKGYNKKYYCKIKNINNNKHFNITFHDSIHNYQNNIKLNKLDVIYSCIMDAQAYESTMDYVDFCNCFGYDIDSRQAEKAYKGCKMEYNQMHDIFTDEEIKELQTIFENY